MKIPTRKIHTKMKDDTPISSIPDVQSSGIFHAIEINQVGVRSVRYPIIVVDRDNIEFQTIGTFDMNVQLAADQRGTHMSRFIEHLEEIGTISSHTFIDTLTNIIQRLNTHGAQIIVEFPFCIRKTAPISKVQSYMDYLVKLEVTKTYQQNIPRSRLTVQVPVTSVCPCSKSISRYGAHNQRSLVSICVECLKPVWIRDIVDYVEEQASCPVYTLLKRLDEKHVTEYGYENPKFVEDLVRDMAHTLNADSRIGHYIVSAENLESIHNHSAYACIERPTECIKQINSKYK